MGRIPFYVIFIGAVLRLSIIECVITGPQYDIAARSKVIDEHLHRDREFGAMEGYLGSLLFREAFGYRFSDAELNELDLLKRLKHMEDPSPYAILKVTNIKGKVEETVVLKSVLERINQQVDGIGYLEHIDKTESLTGFVDGIDAKYPGENGIHLLTLHMKRRAQNLLNTIKQETVVHLPININEDKIETFTEGSHDYKGLNLAKLKKSGQKTTESRGYAARAVDGNTSGIFREASCTHTAYSPAYTDAQKRNPYWWVKLTDSDSDPSLLVRLITIYNRDDCCWDRLADIEVRVLETCDFCNDETPTDVTPGPEESAFSSEDRSTLCFFQKDPLESGRNELFCQNGAVPGRYVVVRMANSVALSLCEVEVYETLHLEYETNLAEGKPAVQSSTAIEGDARLAVDGYLYSVFWHQSCAHTLDPWDATMPPWWRVELAPKDSPLVKVSKVSVTSGGDYNRLSHFRVWVGDEETGIYNLCYFHDAPMAPGATEVLTCRPVLHGRHVRITMDTIDALILCEVRVYGPDW